MNKTCDKYTYTASNADTFGNRQIWEYCILSGQNEDCDNNCKKILNPE